MKIALVGNQNCGKSTLFRTLTNMNVKVGNWPGVTIEKKEGIVKGTSFVLIDLPGIYSLHPYTLEEEVSRNFLLQEKPDLIINVIDSTILERSLYLTLQLLELNIPLIVVLNKEDILEKQGMKIDEKLLSDFLGVSVIKVSALREIGILELITEIKMTRMKTVSERKTVMKLIQESVISAQKKYHVEQEEAEITREI